MIAALFAWLHALRFVPLIIAFSLAAATQVIIPLGCWVFLGEQISLARWAGIFIVTLGVIIIARPLARLEERL
jgi:drug/metabolite transporter (DMT)-like permease